MMALQSRLRRALGTALVAAASLTAAVAAQAADWKPTRPVTLLVPYSPGGGVDAQARAMAEQLQHIWGQPVVVENAPGAGGAIGSRKAATAKPDGHTLLVQLPSLTLIKHLPNFSGPDPVQQLTPVSAFSSQPAVVVTHPSVPGKQVSEVIRYCKAQAEPCSFATTEIMARLLASVLREDAGLPDLVVVNYKGGGQAVTDLIAGNVKLGLTGLTAVLPHQRSGSLRVVMTLGHKRSSVLPDVPTAVESGLKSFDIGTWYGLFAPKGTPPDVVQGIASAVKQATRSEGVRKAFASIGADPIGNTPAEFATMVQTEVDRYAALTKRFPIEE
jgi:tripartite-type tricarboxylate transporter receptor subunit TctC